MTHFLITINWHGRTFTRPMQLNDKFEAQECADRIYPGAHVVKVERM
jgi:hypothetical protein